MQYEDRVTISTPEGVDLEMTLAGIGSRFIAALIDGLIQFLIILPLALVMAAASPSPTDFTPALLALAFAVIAVLIFLVLFGYNILFETLGSGRSLGKRWTGLRVVEASGAPVGFTSSAVRNILRLVDWLPFGYAVGLVTALVTERNQRLGDLAAGTIVVRERRGDAALPVYGSTASAIPAPSWDVGAVTQDELAAVRRFLQRRFELDQAARARIAWDLAARLRPKVPGAPESEHPELFLEQIAAARAARH